MAAQPQQRRRRVVHSSMRTCPPPCPRVTSSPGALAHAATGAAERRAVAGTAGASWATQRLLRSRGFSDAEASNLTAYVAGLRVAGRGWAMSELEGLMFIRWLVDTGRLAS